MSAEKTVVAAAGIVLAPPAEASPAAPPPTVAPATAPAAKERRSPVGPAATAAAAAVPAPKVRVKVLPGHSVVHGSRFESGFHKPGAGPGTIIELDAAEAARLKKRGVVGPVNAQVKSKVAGDGLTLSTSDGPKVQGPSF